ncbi:uncharacterized protein TA03885 [Theileria annulata]|uniref:SfiI-subtelomeric related protein family member n=1 Tax=Theileria annulata TaxID=5874 RepID=Q4UCC7_THEAN|nr:uncharacterized protein TA03885 [Theileria annulata]CAI75524.1 hypothetical protein, conserved [Theileria annulata]|eukprot:XP_955000.1 hypothetical protein, conserved [Theileria annulata]
MLNYIIILIILNYIKCDNIIYDINDKSSDYVMINEFKATFTSTSSMIPYQDINIIKVIDQNHILWESNTLNESCTYILLFKFEEIIMLILKIKNKNEYKKYHLIKNNNWINLDEKDFKELLIELRLKLPNENQILIDINKPNEEKFKIKRRNIGGADFITFTTYYPYNLIKIVQDTEVIWRAKLNEDYCIDCVVYMKNEQYELLQIFICTRDYIGFKFFNKINNQWEIIDKNDFYNKLYQLDLQENQRQINQSNIDSISGSEGMGKSGNESIVGEGKSDGVVGIMNNIMNECNYYKCNKFF